VARGEAFLQVLRLAREIGVLKVGTVSIDGTHIRANASKDKNVRYDRAGELERQLESDVQRLLQEAERTDRREDDDGQSLPKEIARREKLRGKMQQAREQLERRAKQRAEAQQAEYERKVRDRQPREGKRKGKKPKPPKDTPDAHEKTNLTDADSRLMRKSKRSSYGQTYNGQATVDADGSQLILGGHVSTCASDANELVPAVEDVAEEIGNVSTVLADSGYVNADAWDSLEQDGVDLYVAVSRAEVSGEWEPVRLAYNVKRLWVLKTARKPCGTVVHAVPQGLRTPIRLTLARDRGRARRVQPSRICHNESRPSADHNSPSEVRQTPSRSGGRRGCWRRRPGRWVGR